MCYICIYIHIYRSTKYEEGSVVKGSQIGHNFLRLGPDKALPVLLLSVLSILYYLLKNNYEI